VTEIRIPKMGMSTVEVDILSVLVKPGDRVEVGQPLVEVESEKATFMVESDVAGTVAEVRVEEEDICEVGDVIVVVDEG
jgi:pyruvate/2-oxoglutarate dehydrogenase complex dihydrolipoamide acyltransferase (E2) component